MNRELRIELFRDEEFDEFSIQNVGIIKKKEG